MRRDFIKRVIGTPALGLVALALGACIYRIDIQQGNLLEEEAIEQVAVGMTKNQVVFLLGTPMVTDSFHTNRWDYTYYLRRGRSDDVERRWLIVYFDGDVVSRVEKDVALDPAS
ncbi:MAG TPA: outer membrane protein assembly factor BamE [Gammaproteobacteria bacterium]|nr:outer membrane protein assembly factor BamE [Gammaproteobacteria bacterium]